MFLLLCVCECSVVRWSSLSWSMCEGVMSRYRMFAAQRKALFWIACMFSSCVLDMVCSGTGVYSNMGLITLYTELSLCCTLCESV